jgi:hypothetical protein
VQGGADGKVDYNKLIEQVTAAAAAAMHTNWEQFR